ncbi:MAG: biotin/lipoyl-binding carrier protein [Euryarchaeota archaeon]|nr:biotin/lipoyl-binding carrier protein [Euryarchaeota archaeon]
MATEVKSPITANVWKIQVQVGAQVKTGDVLTILESMKMEIPVESPCTGTVKEVRIKEGESVVEEAVIFIIG